MEGERNLKWPGHLNLKVCEVDGHLKIFDAIVLKEIWNGKVSDIWNGERVIPRGWNFNEYCATNSGSPEVELRFCPWLLLFKYWGGLT
jgi:hypothetical protein